MISIYRGILTGYNDAFVVDEATRENLVREDPRSADLLKPMLRGRDIRPYRAQWAGLWLILTLPSMNVDINDYPAIKRHLLAFGRPRLEQSGKALRGGGNARKKPHRWYELQDTCAYHEEFSKPKLFWMDMSPVGRFCYEQQETFSNDKAFLMGGRPRDLKYLCAILNSSVISWYVARTALTTGEGLIQWKKFTVQSIPVPRPGRVQRSYIDVVDEVMRSSDVEQGEVDRLDEMVSASYGLTDRERTFVRASYRRSLGGSA